VYRDVSYNFAMHIRAITSRLPNTNLAVDWVSNPQRLNGYKMTYVQPTYNIRTIMYKLYCLFSVLC